MERARLLSAAQRETYTEQKDEPPNSDNDKEYMWVESTICQSGKLSEEDSFVGESDANNQIIRMVSRNIDHRKRNDQVRELLAEAEEHTRTNNAKMGYMQCVAHDLKTPLQSFSYSLDLLKHTALDAEQRGFISLACVAVDLLKLTISQTMDIGKALTGSKLQPRRTTLFLSSIIDRVRMIM